jgi:hypothetical protein
MSITSIRRSTGALAFLYVLFGSSVHANTNPIENAVKVLCSEGVSRILLPEDHESLNMMGINLAALNGALSAGKTVHFCREMKPKQLEVNGLTLDDYPYSDPVLRWRLARVTASLVSKKMELAALDADPDVDEFVKVVVRRNIQIHPLLLTEPSKFNLDRVNKLNGVVLMSAGLLHLEATAPRLDMLAIPWHPEGILMPVPRAFPGSFDSFKRVVGAFYKKGRHTALIRDGAIWDHREHPYMFNKTATVDYYNKLGFAALDIMSGASVNSTIIFPAEHMKSLQRKLKAGKKHVYTCDDLCMQFIPNAHGEL